MGPGSVTRADSAGPTSLCSEEQQAFIAVPTLVFMSIAGLPGFSTAVIRVSGTPNLPHQNLSWSETVCNTFVAHLAMCLTNKIHSIAGTAVGSLHRYLYFAAQEKKMAFASLGVCH